MTNPNDSAFPQEYEVGKLPIEAGRTLRGLTRREWFAGMAMHDVITNRGYPFSAKEQARRALEFADALIKELNK